ncbi:MAG: hypothetical protein ABRQ39_27865, partial [Candidatus Eremiobacterota bacterium]
MAKIDSHNITSTSYPQQSRQQIFQETQAEEKKELEKKEKEINEKIEDGQLEQRKASAHEGPEKDSYQKPAQSSEVSTKDISNFKRSSKQAKIEETPGNSGKETAAQKLKQKEANKSRIKTLKSVSKRITGASKKETGNRTKKSGVQKGHKKEKKNIQQKSYRGNSHIIDNKNKYAYRDLMPLEEKKKSKLSPGEGDKNRQIPEKNFRNIPPDTAIAEKIPPGEEIKKIKEKQEEEKHPGINRTTTKTSKDSFKSNKLIPLSEIRKNYEKKYNEINKTDFEQRTLSGEKNIRETKKDDNSSKSQEAINQNKATGMQYKKSVNNLPEERKKLTEDKEIAREKSVFADELTGKKEIRNVKIDHVSKDIEELKGLENKENLSEKEKGEIREKRKEAEDIKNEREKFEKEITAKENRSENEINTKRPAESDGNMAIEAADMSKPAMDKNKIPKLISLEKLRGNYNRKYDGFKTKELIRDQNSEHVRKDNKDISSKNKYTEPDRIYKEAGINESSMKQSGEKIKERDIEKIIQGKIQSVSEKSMGSDRKSDLIKEKNFPDESQKAQEKQPDFERKTGSIEKREEVQKKFKEILFELRGTEDKEPEKSIISDRKSDLIKEKNFPDESQKAQEKQPDFERKFDGNEKRETLQEKFKNILSE